MAKNERAKVEASEARLSNIHAKLEARVAELEQRRALSDVEAMELKKLKKEKLATKDELSSRGSRG